MLTNSEPFKVPAVQISLVFSFPAITLGLGFSRCARAVISYISVSSSFSVLPPCAFVFKKITQADNPLAFRLWDFARWQTYVGYWLLSPKSTLKKL